MTPEQLDAMRARRRIMDTARRRRLGAKPQKRVTPEQLAETRRRASLNYYYRNRERILAEARAKNEAEGRARKPAMTPEERKVRDRERRAAKRRAAGIEPRKKRTPEEIREYHRAWAERRRRRLGMKPRAVWQAEMAARPWSKDKIQQNATESLEAAEARIYGAVQEARAALIEAGGELADLMREQKKDEYLKTRFHAPGVVMSLDETFEDGEQKTATAITPDFSDELIERLSWEEE